MVCEIVDVVSAIGEDSPLSVNEADAGCGRDHTLETFGSVQAGESRHGALEWMNVGACGS
jgi:hypothetical protein